RKRKSSASERRSRPQGRSRNFRREESAATRRHHHGRQRPLGGQTRPAARRRAQGRRRGGPPGDAGGGRQWRRGPDALRLLVGKLEAEQRGNCRSYQPDALLSRSRACLARQGGRQAQADRRIFCVRAGARGRPYFGQFAADPGRRAELRLARRNHRGGKGACQPGGGWRHRSCANRGDRLRSAARYLRPSGARPAHTDLGRRATFELPAVAGGLCRADIRRKAVAGLFRARFRRGNRAFHGARAPVRWAVNELFVRTATGLVLIALALLTAEVGGTVFAVFVAAIATAMFYEWTRIVRGWGAAWYVSGFVYALVPAL